VTKIIKMIVMDLDPPKAAAKPELLFKKPASGPIQLESTLFRLSNETLKNVLLRKRPNLL
jgi:hypothetical protein